MRYFVGATMYGTCSLHQGSVFTNFAPPLFSIASGFNAQQSDIKKAHGK